MDTVLLIFMVYLAGVLIATVVLALLSRWDLLSVGDAAPVLIALWPFTMFMLVLFVVAIPFMYLYDWIAGNR